MRARAARAHEIDAYGRNIRQVQGKILTDYDVVIGDQKTPSDYHPELTGKLSIVRS